MCLSFAKAFGLFRNDNGQIVLDVGIGKIHRFFADIVDCNGGANYIIILPHSAEDCVKGAVYIIYFKAQLNGNRLGQINIKANGHIVFVIGFIRRITDFAAYSKVAVVYQFGFAIPRFFL